MGTEILWSGGNMDWCCVVCLSLLGISSSKNRNFPHQYHKHYFWSLMMATQLNINYVSAKYYSILIKSECLAMAVTDTETETVQVVSTARGQQTTIQSSEGGSQCWCRNLPLLYFSRKGIISQIFLALNNLNYSILNINNKTGIGLAYTFIPHSSACFN